MAAQPPRPPIEGPETISGAHFSQIAAPRPPNRESDFFTFLHKAIFAPSPAEGAGVEERRRTTCAERKASPRVSSQDPRAVIGIPELDHPRRKRVTMSSKITFFSRLELTQSGYLLSCCHVSLGHDATLPHYGQHIS